MTGPAPPFNPNVPSIARTYDYLLGDKDNYPVDREIGEIFIQRFPGAVQIAVDNRRSLVRAVDFMARDLGVTQFLDLGSGLPTADNVHQVAQGANPAARVVYVDNDPIVLAHGRALQSEQIIAAKETNTLIDFGRPVGIIASAILHHIVDAEDPLGIIRAFRDAVPAGSYLFISHFRTLGDPDSAALEEVMFQAFGRGAWRTDAQIAQYFEGVKLLTPGIVPCAQWRPEQEPGELSAFQRLVVAGLGRK